MKFHSDAPSPRYCATLWTLVGHPSRGCEWSVTEKLTAIAAAGFDGVHDSLTPQHIALAKRLGLEVIGRLDGRFSDSWQESLTTQVDHGVTLFNTHLGQHDTPAETAASMAAAMYTAGRRLGACVQFETHRDTATETPEKYEGVKERFVTLTGQPFPTTWDHSHLAVMKHLLPTDFAPRLLGWQQEIQASQLFHCRPFNGQHTQIPVTDGHGQLTPEFAAYRSFATELFCLWRNGPAPRPPLWICPELGASDGYHLSTHPSPWLDAIRCFEELKLAWNQA